jgi:hypothetical protein
MATISKPISAQTQTERPAESITQESIWKKIPEASPATKKAHKLYQERLKINQYLKECAPNSV